MIQSCKKNKLFRRKPRSENRPPFFRSNIAVFQLDSFAQGFYTPLLTQHEQPGFSQKHLEQISFSKPAAAEKLCTAIKSISKT
jgi:hypothetical protein